MTDTKRNPLDDLLDSVQRDTTTWDKELEPTIAGTVVATSTVTGEYGESPTITILTADEREVRIFGHGAVLRNRFYEADLRPDDQVAIRYLGKTTPHSGGKAYHDYKVVVRPAARRDVAPGSGTEPAAPVAARLGAARSEPVAYDDDDDF